MWVELVAWEDPNIFIIYLEWAGENISVILSQLKSI